MALISLALANKPSRMEERLNQAQDSIRTSIALLSCKEHMIQSSPLGGFIRVILDSMINQNARDL